MLKVRNYFQIRPEDEVKPEVARHFKHNFIVNALDNSIWLFGDSFVSMSTILPVFAATLTDSPLVIGLIPALLNAGWFLPQLFMAGLVQRLRKVLPLARKMGIVERIPITFFPLLVFLLPGINKSLAVWIFILLIAWRGFASGFVALPWQELIARVIPISHRARFFGSSRLFGQILGVVGSIIAALIFRSLLYPYNYAVSFSIALVANWVCFIFFSMTIEPETKTGETQVLPEGDRVKAGLIDFKAFGRILKSDRNFIFYLLSRAASFIGNMASGFMAVYAIQHFSLPDDQAAIFTGLLFLSGVTGYLVWGSLGDKIGPKRVVFLSGILWAGSVTLAMLSRTVWVYYGVFLLMGLASSGGILGDLMLVMELGDEDQRPNYLGLARTLPGIFLLFSPLLAGLIIRSGSYQMMFGVSLAFLVMGLLFLLRVKDRGRVKVRSVS